VPNDLDLLCYDVFNNKTLKLLSVIVFVDAKIFFLRNKKPVFIVYL